jgi:hypothetical protein
MPDNHSRFECLVSIIERNMEAIKRKYREDGGWSRKDRGQDERHERWPRSNGDQAIKDGGHNKEWPRRN